MSAPVRLYDSTDLARALGVTPSAVSNYRARGSRALPAPAYYLRRHETGRVKPLYTAAAIAEVIAMRHAELDRLGAELARELDL